MTEYDFIFNSIGELACVKKSDSEYENVELSKIKQNEAKDYFEECIEIKEEVNSEHTKWKKIVKSSCRMCDGDTCKINVYSNEDCYKNIISTAKEICDVVDKRIVIEYRMSPVIIDHKLMTLLADKEKEAYKLFKERTVYSEETEADNNKLFKGLYDDISKIYGVNIEYYHLVINSVSYIENHPNEELWQLQLNCFRAFTALCGGIHTGEVFGTDLATVFKRFTQYLDEFSRGVVNNK